MLTIRDIIAMVTRVISALLLSHIHYAYKIGIHVDSTGNADNFVIM